jgi:hypothetical protein
MYVEIKTPSECLSMLYLRSMLYCLCTFASLASPVPHLRLSSHSTPHGRNNLTTPLLRLLRSLGSQLHQPENQSISTDSEDNGDRSISPST